MSERPTDDTVPYLRKAYKAWGLLWIAYNAVLLASGAIVLGSLRALAKSADHLYCRSLFGDKLWFGVILFGMLVNVFYILGPLLDAYVRIFLRRRLGRWRYALFTTGLLPTDTAYRIAPTRLPKPVIARRNDEAIFFRIAVALEQVGHCASIRWPNRKWRGLPRHS